MESDNTGSPLLQVTDLECRYGEQTILQDVNFSLRPGEIACLLGPSGCGKTTLLHALAGFQPIFAGNITLQQRTLSDAGKQLPPEQRNIGVVFQDYALFPHLSVADNIAFGLKGMAKTARYARVNELLQLIRMESYASQFPHQLSGGQQQRVALARALAPRPQLLLMDEPFSNLDTELRRALAAEVRQILQRENLAAIVVTHDREEAFVVGDKLGVLAHGYLQQWGTPATVYAAPATLAVAKVIEQGTILPGKATAAGLVQSELGQFPLPPGEWQSDTPVAVFVRNADLEITAESAITAQVIERYFLGENTLYRLQLASGKVIDAALSSARELAPGQQVHVSVRNPLVFGADR